MKEAHTSSPATVSHMKKASLQIGLQRSKPILPQRGKMGIPLQSLMTHLPPHQRGTHSPIPYYVWTEDLRCGMQESRPHHKAVEVQKGVSKTSTSYFIFTEVQVNDQWHCINPQVMKLLPIEHLVLVPTLRSDSRYQFEKAYRQLEYDGHPFTVGEMSRNLQASVNDWLTPEDSVRIAVCYDDILKLLNASGKEHSAFALRSEVAAFQNDESDNIWDFVSVDEYRKMEDELKKAYQYFEWNDRSGAYRYYEEIQKKVTAQVKDWKAINPRAEITFVRIMLFST